MEMEKTISIINNYIIEKLNLIKTKDDNLINLYDKSYFTDENHLKYLVCFNIFKDIKELENKWEEYQNEDIATYLQSQKYYNNDIKWDIYYILIYLGDDRVPPEIWLSIEKDKFCCKKVFISSESKASIIEQLKQKLPMVKDYYPYKKSRVINDKYFFEKVCEELKIPKDVVINDENKELKNEIQIIAAIVKALGGDKI